MSIRSQRTKVQPRHDFNLSRQNDSVKNRKPIIHLIYRAADAFYTLQLFEKLDVQLFRTEFVEWITHGTCHPTKRIEWGLQRTIFDARGHMLLVHSCPNWIVHALVIDLSAHIDEQLNWPEQIGLRVNTANPRASGSLSWYACRYIYWPTSRLTRLRILVHLDCRRWYLRCSHCIGLGLGLGLGLGAVQSLYYANHSVTRAPRWKIQ